MQGDFSDVLTLYNRFVENGKEAWQRTVITGVEVMDRLGEAMRHSGAASSSARRVGPVSVSVLTALLPKRVQPGYLPPMEWRMTENRTGCWTLQPGDILVPESCQREVVESVAELSQECDRVAVIGTVTDFGGRGDLCHWEVTAR